MNPDLLTAEDHQSMVVGILTNDLNASLKTAESVFEHCHFTAKTKKQLVRESLKTSAVSLPITTVIVIKRNTDSFVKY